MYMYMYMHGKCPLALPSVHSQMGFGISLVLLQSDVSSSKLSLSLHFGTQGLARVSLYSVRAFPDSRNPHSLYSTIDTI